MSKSPRQKSTAKVAQRKETYDGAGCSVCGTHTSSSFRNSEVGRICNSCHCKTYRLKRKSGGLPAGSGGSSSRAAARPRTAAAQRQQQQWYEHEEEEEEEEEVEDREQQQWQRQGQQQQVHCDDWPPHTPEAQFMSAAERGSQEPESSWQEGMLQMEAFMQQQQQQQAAAPEPPTPQRLMADLQRRVFQETAGGGPPADVARIQHCARRAQQASPGCLHRGALCVLPSMQLQLPDDPPGLLHTVSCLVEAVVGPLDLGEQAADSQVQQQQQQPAAVAQEAAVRLTVFAAAGAVACWHEAPPQPTIPLSFSPLTREPSWTSGPGGFSLHFPGPFCPQIDLFAASHRYVAAAGPAAACQPTLCLDPTPQAAAVAAAAGAAASWDACLAAQHTPFAQQAPAGSGAGVAHANWHCQLELPGHLLGSWSFLATGQPAKHPLLQPANSLADAAAGAVAAATSDHLIRLSSQGGSGGNGGGGGSSPVQQEHAAPPPPFGSFHVASFPHLPSGPLLSGLDATCPPDLPCFLDPHSHMLMMTADY